MASLWFLFWSAFLVGFSGAMMPGPVLTATISEVMKRGFKAGPLIVLGHALLEIVVLVARAPARLRAVVSCRMTAEDAHEVAPRAQFARYAERQHLSSSRKLGEKLVHHQQDIHARPLFR